MCRKYERDYHHSAGRAGEVGEEETAWRKSRIAAASRASSPPSGKFLNGLKDYNLLELLKVLFAVFVFALLISFVRNPEMYIEKAGYAFELHKNRLYKWHLFRSYTKDVDLGYKPWYRRLCYFLLVF